MTGKNVNVFSLVVLGIVVIAFILVALNAAPSNRSLADSNAVLAAFTGMAVAIERVLEVMWIIVGLTVTDGA
jgi:hypothetical protein